MTDHLPAEPPHVARPLDEVGLWWQQDIYDAQKRVDKAYQTLFMLQSNPPKSVHKRLSLYQDASRLLMSHVNVLDDVIKGLSRELEQERGAAPENARRRWTEEEDEMLINSVAQDHFSVQQLANAYKRTPGAIAARVSHLVGIKRISYAVAAGISGYLDGQHVEGTFVGNVMPK